LIHSKYRFRPAAIPGLPAVPVDGDHLAVQDRPDELVDPHVRPLEGAIHRKIPERYHGYAVVLPVEVSEVFCRKL